MNEFTLPAAFGVSAGCPSCAMCGETDGHAIGCGLFGITESHRQNPVNLIALIRSPAAGREFDNGETHATWRDLRETMPEVSALDIGTGQRKIHIELTAPDAADPNWRVLLRCDSAPFLEATIRGRYLTRDNALDAAEEYSKALLFRPEVSRR